MTKNLQKQPINDVVWIDREDLFSNSYNPNKVAPPELKLLKQSIMNSGWTQPIVIRESKEIIDGFHRWTVSSDPDIHKLTGGKVPTVTIKDINEDEQMMATIRHNRARGTHGVSPMSTIVQKLKDEHGLDHKELNGLLGMEDEEINRLYEKGSIELIRRHSEESKTGKYEDLRQEWAKKNDFGEAWEPSKD